MLKLRVPIIYYILILLYVVQIAVGSRCNLPLAISLNCLQTDGNLQYIIFSVALHDKRLCPYEYQIVTLYSRYSTIPTL